MKLSPTLFKAYDLRGLVGSELTPAVATAVGRALADFLPHPGPVALGYDMRPDSHELAAALRAGLMRQGRTVYDIGEVASDIIYFAVGHLQAAGGAMVTASHNPGAYNGIKLCREQARPIGVDSGLADLRAAIVADRYQPAPAAPGRHESHDVMASWINHALGFIHPATLKPYHIAVDAGNGMAGLVVPHLAGRWPLTVDPLYFELDGTFPNHPANPLIEANNRDLIAKVQAGHLDFGLAFDGDGDRAFLIDPRGHTVPGHIMTALLARHFLLANPGATIIYDARNSRLIPDVASELGGHAVRSRVGHAFIKEQMRAHHAVFGGEFSGHFYFRDNYYADSGLIAALVAIQVISDSGRTLSSLVDDYAARYARSPEINFPVADTAATLARLRRYYADGQPDDLDGLTVNYPDWWFNVRPSNTEPLLRLNVEATTPQLLQTQLAQLQSLLTK